MSKINKKKKDNILKHIEKMSDKEWIKNKDSFNDISRLAGIFSKDDKLEIDKILKSEDNLRPRGN